MSADHRMQMVPFNYNPVRLNDNEFILYEGVFLDEDSQEQWITWSGKGRGERSSADKKRFKPRAAHIKK